MTKRYLVAAKLWMQTSVVLAAMLLSAVLFNSAAFASASSYQSNCAAFQEEVSANNGPTALYFDVGDKLTVKGVAHYGDANSRWFNLVAIDYANSNLTDGTTLFNYTRGFYAGSGTESISYVADHAVHYLGIQRYAASADASFNFTYWPMDTYIQCTPRPAVTATDLQSSASPVVVGDSVTLTATVSNQDTPATSPTGNVDFYAGTTLVGSVALDNGTASLVTTELPVGQYNITAKYRGVAEKFAGSESAPVSQLVADKTTTTITSSLNPAYPGQPAEITITVTGTSLTPTGSVVLFSDFGPPATLTLVDGSVKVPLEVPVGASLPWSGVFHAEYLGTAVFAASVSTDLLQKVERVPTTTVLTSTPNPARYGTTINLAATVKNNLGNAPDTGVVVFAVDGQSMAQKPLISGVAHFDLLNLPEGDHTITERYLQNTRASSSSDSLSQIIYVAEDTTTVLTSTPNPALIGEMVTFTATVTGADTSKPATGSVEFRQGADVIGTATLSSGTATITKVFAAADGYAVTAHYLGQQGEFLASDSQALNQVINKIPASVTLTSTPNPAQLNQPVTLTATVTAGGDTATGTIEFMDGKTSLGTATLAQGVATLTVTSLAEGGHNLAAVYSGDATHDDSASDVLSQQIDTQSAEIDDVQEKASGAAAGISAEITTDLTSEAITDALSGQVQVMSASDGQVGFTWAPGLTRGGTMIVPTADAGEGPLTTDSAMRFWLKGRYTDWDAGNLDGKQWNGLLGASVLFGDGLVAGLVGGYESYDYEDTVGATLDGDGLSIGGYIGGKLADNLTFDTQAHAAFIGYDVASGGVTGDFDAKRLIAAGGFAYTLQQGAFTFTPSLRASGMWEWQDGYTDSAAMAHAARGFGNARVSGGAKASYTVPLADGGRLTPFIAGFGDWRVSDGDQTVDSALDGLSARAEGGFDLQTAGGINLGASVEFMGLGIDDTLATSYNANLSIPF